MRQRGEPALQRIESGRILAWRSGGAQLIDEGGVGLEHPCVFLVSANVVGDDLAEAATIWLKVANEALATVSLLGGFGAPVGGDKASKVVVFRGFLLEDGAEEAEKSILAVFLRLVPKVMAAQAFELLDLVGRENLVEWKRARWKLALWRTGAAAAVAAAAARTRAARSGVALGNSSAESSSEILA